MDIGEKFGDNLRRVRKSIGFSQEEVGFLAALHRTEIGLLERGHRVPRIDTLIKLASALGEPIDCVLLDGITWSPGTTDAGAFSVSPEGQGRRSE